MEALNLTPTEQRIDRAPKFLNLNEHFGPTVQGEGRHAGQLCSFFRVALCNLSCSWCDTKYTWDFGTEPGQYDRSKEVHKTSIDDASAIVDSFVTRRIVVSGGEPLSQARALAELMRRHPDKLWEVETNGTKSLGPTAGLWSTVTCSPKIIPSADQGAAGRRLQEDVLEVADLKFVVHDDADLAAIVSFVEERDFPRERVWLMPEGVTPDELTAKSGFVADAAIEHGFSFSSRLHVYAWHDVRGH